MPDPDENSMKRGLNKGKCGFAARMDYGVKVGVMEHWSVGVPG
jgi:hypothetical protein